jgi:hypothetical protein
MRLSQRAQPAGDGGQLLSRVLASLQGNVEVQKLNGFRFECMRQSQDYFLTGSKFLKIYKQYGIYLRKQEQRDLLDYLSLGARKNTYNLDQLTKLFQVIARLQYKVQLEHTAETVEPKKSQMD